MSCVSNSKTVSFLSYVSEETATGQYFYFFLSYASEETRRLLQDMKTVLEKFVEKIFFPIGPVTFGP